MALSIDRNAAAVLENGSGRWWVADVSSAGVISGSFSAGPIIKDSTIKKASTSKTKEDEGGTTYPAGSTVTGEFTGTYMQRDQQVYDFIEYCNGNYIAAVKELSSKAVDGKFQYAYLPIMKGDGSVELKFPGGEIPFKFDLTPAPTSLSLNLGTYGSQFTGAGVSSFGSSTVVCSADEYFKTFEIAT